MHILKRIKKGSLKIVGDGLSFSVDMPGKPSAQILLKNKKAFFEAVFWKGDVGMGETYASGIWNTPDILSVAMVLVGNRDNIQPKMKLIPSSKTSTAYDTKVVRHHYDVGNDFYSSFLKDKLMAYSCGFFFCPGDDLDKAQHNKTDHIINKLGIKSGDSVLDIGCGWGRIAEYVSKKNGRECSWYNTF